jgi:hypothetical protein
LKDPIDLLRAPSFAIGWRVATVSLGVALCLAACGQTSTTASSPAQPVATAVTSRAPESSAASANAATENPKLGDLAVATTAPDSPGMDALGTGTLGGKTDRGVGCFWLASSGGSRTALVWPFGFTAQTDPLRLLGGDGQVVAQSGDRVELGGGSFPDSVPRPEDDPCSIGTTFIVSTVAAVNGVQVNVGAGSLKLETRAPGSLPSCSDAAATDLMVVMANGEVEVMLPSGLSLPATWPAGFAARWGNRVEVTDDTAVPVMTQGVRNADVKALMASDHVDICGVGSRI